MQLTILYTVQHLKQMQDLNWTLHHIVIVYHLAR